MDPADRLYPGPVTKRAYQGHTPYCPPVPGLPADFRLTPGMAVMVPVGVIPAEANGQPAVICYATVMHPASDSERKIYEGDPGEVWWLDVHAGGAHLPQMYRRTEILGVPALGFVPPSQPGPHLEPVRSPRGFALLPALPGAYGGSVEVYESSAASGPHIWLKAVDPDGNEVLVHLAAENAWRFGEQIHTLVKNHYQGDDSASATAGDTEQVVEVYGWTDGSETTVTHPPHKTGEPQVYTPDGPQPTVVRTAPDPDAPWLADHAEDETDPGGPIMNLPEKTYRYPARPDGRG